MSTYHQFKYTITVNKPNLPEEFKTFTSSPIWDVNGKLAGDLIPHVISTIHNFLWLRNSMPVHTMNEVIDVLASLESSEVNTTDYSIAFTIKPVEVENETHHVSDAMKNQWNATCNKYKRTVK